MTTEDTPSATTRSGRTRRAARVEQRFDALRARLVQRLGLDRPLHIRPYRWYGTAETLGVRGRVLAQRNLRPSAPGDDDDASLWDNLLASYRRFESDELPGARLTATADGTTIELVCDDEGYFHGRLARPPDAAAPEPRPYWQTVALQLTGSPGRSLPPVPVTAEAAVCVPPATARFGVISDIDDTILQTHAANLLQAARLTLLAGPRQRLPFPGVAAFYRALQAGASGAEQNPIVYVSSSPWNLYDLLDDFMAWQAIPSGPLCLRDIGLDETKALASSHHAHKWEQITAVLETYPHLPFLLIGDSGQKDPEIYAEVARAYPGRIWAIVIRDVSAADRDAQVDQIAADVTAATGALFVRAADTLAAAQLAAARGWIAQDRVEAVAAESAA